MLLYKYNTLNKEFFKSGRYAVFTQFLTSDYNNISRYDSSGNYIAKFYKVKLYHQLNNGYLDLTEDVWTKYRASGLTDVHWFGNPNFKYYCPNQYKGKLSASVEIEDAYNFKLSNIPNITTDGSTFTLNLQVNVTPKDNVIIGFGSISIYSLVVKYSIDGVANAIEVAVPSVLDPINISITNIPLADKDKLLTYSITPKITVEGFTDVYYEELPEEFFNTYNINGTVRISTDLQGISFTPIAQNYDCDLAVNSKIYNEFILTDENGVYLTNTLTVSTTPYVFLRNGAQQTAGTILLGIYDVINNKPLVHTPTSLPLDAVVISLFEKTTAETPSADCVAQTTITLTINFNIALSTGTTVSITQSGEPEQYVVGSLLSTLVFNVVSGKAIKIEVKRSGYTAILLTNLIYSANTIINLAFITNVLFKVSSNPLDNSGNYWVEWSSSESIPTTLSLLYDVDASSGSAGHDLAASITPLWNGTKYMSELIPVLDVTKMTVWSVLLSATNTNVTTTYANISDNSKYGIIGGQIFKRQIV